MKISRLIIGLLLISILHSQFAVAGIAATAVRDTASFILSKFGKGAAGQTVEELTEASARVLAKHGDEALPYLRSTGHAGFTALEEAGGRAPDVIKLFARKGDEAIWIISEPRKLSIFLKHGDSAADALFKHPGIADSLISKFGDPAVGALNKVSRQNGQRLGIAANEGFLTASDRSPELLGVVRQYGDAAMDFIWTNKGPLAVASILGSFLVDPAPYINGIKTLVVDPIVSPIVGSINWTFLVAAILVVMFLPFIARSIRKSRSAYKEK
jgi:hypothetical protein